jgi:hypothetical protein
MIDMRQTELQLVVEEAHQNASRAQRSLDEADFRNAIRLGRMAWGAVDRYTDESRSAFEAWIRGSLIESQAWDYLDQGARAESSARRSLKRAERCDPAGLWQATSEIRVIETKEWRQDLIPASLGYWRLAGHLTRANTGHDLSLVCCYQMISCAVKGAPREIADLANKQGKRLLPAVGDEGIVGSFKRWQAVDLADREPHTAASLDRADLLLRESRELKARKASSRVEIGEHFPRAFLEFARESPNAEAITQAAIEEAERVDLHQYVRGCKMLLSRFMA